MPAADPMDQHDESPGLDDPMAANEATLDSSSNPRKRKKSSRAFRSAQLSPVHVLTKQNAKPRCGYCERHGKNCLYLRPQKKRGPAQGYRSALYSMRESAAAWGAVLHLVPSLAPVIEGYFKKEDGKRLIRAIKDPQQQEFYIQTWQQSSAAGPSPSSSSSTLFPPLPQAHFSSLPYDPKLESLLHHTPQNDAPIQSLGGSMASLGVPTVSLSDILARAAAQPSTNFSQALGSLGFAPEETLNDFVAMSYNPDLLDGSIDTDPLLGSDLDQKAYYELLMGRRYA
ncbi:quinic acid utilization activator [Ophiostoma piceae UAMH 11346]|uniref:Quinic acid utilization activator n=1 Tax=Ophiostoma piceae (strain UAMH 11346) TaxID=1262450 RepID=S3C8P8_OPHP1|nr:quinic acid utilization activator [Ophiostoma piceae UAMH 11346]